MAVRSNPVQLERQEIVAQMTSAPGRDGDATHHWSFSGRRGGAGGAGGQRRDVSHLRRRLRTVATGAGAARRGRDCPPRPANRFGRRSSCKSNGGRRTRRVCRQVPGDVQARERPSGRSQRVSHGDDSPYDRRLRQPAARRSHRTGRPGERIGQGIERATGPDAPPRTCPTSRESFTKRNRLFSPSLSRTPVGTPVRCKG